MREQNDLATTEAFLLKAIALAPRFPQAQGNYASLLDNMGRLEESERRHKATLDADPRNSIHWYNYGMLLHQTMQRYSEAAECYRQSVAIDPNDANPWGMLAEVLRAYLGRPAEAEPIFKRAIALDPESPVDHWNYGCLLYDSRPPRLDEALIHYRKAEELGISQYGVDAAAMIGDVERDIRERDAT